MSEDKIQKEIKEISFEWVKDYTKRFHWKEYNSGKVFTYFDNDNNKIVVNEKDYEVLVNDRAKEIVKELQQFADTIREEERESLKLKISKLQAYSHREFAESREELFLKVKDVFGIINNIE